MIPESRAWLLIGFLIVLPLLVSNLLRYAFRKRGGIGAGWGSALIVLACWITAIVLIWQRVSR